MFILNHLENLIFAKTNSDELKKESLGQQNSSSFHEILHSAVNDASRLETDKLQTYAALSQDITDRREANAGLTEPFKVELFNDRLNKENKVESFAVTPIAIESSAEKVSSPVERAKEIPTEENFEKVDYRVQTSVTKEINEEESPVKAESAANKEISSSILLQAFLKLDTKETSAELKPVSKKENSEAKSDGRVVTLDSKIEKDGKQVITTSDVTKLTKEVVLRDSNFKKVESKISTNEVFQTKGKELKMEIDSKELSIREISKETLKDIQKEVKSEDNTKLSTNQPKSKEIPVSILKNSSDGKQEVSAVEISNKTNTLIKDELSSRDLLSTEIRKSKKTSESDSKDKSISENSKPVVKEFASVEKEVRFARETLVEVSGLDKNKWTITRREKDMETSNIERRKESMTLLNEIAAKSSSSQTSSDSDKSFSNPRYETNGLKVFSENLKTANSDKPREALFDRENFSKSLNDLVNKARVNIVENGRNTAQISLYPKDLGKMTLNIDVIKEKVEGKILVDSEFIKNRLLGDISQLKADLKANGLDLQAISIEVRSEGSLAFDFANPSSEKDSSKKDADKANSSLPQGVSLEETLESEFSNKSYNLVDIKI
ncbi:MAG: flagellar hook-length control protein FliK [Leptospiraceae bacterium]|nr:flagellar hook-length control protein FliK [Leptospiraceae bacterium]